jgi:hypothetical protein
MIVVDKNNQTLMALDGRFEEPKTCPKAPNGVCPHCNNTLFPLYGPGSPYGFGTYDVCTVCWLVFNFVEDTEE